MIGWYVHHHGRGHLTRGQAVWTRLDEDVTVLSSLPATGDAAWIELERDDDVAGAGLDVDAGARLHWVPTNSPGLSARMARIAGWIAAAAPRVMVVDVSVEVSVLARLCGVPVIVMAGPGERDDQAHQLAYDVAQHIIAPWPREVYDPVFLHPYRHKTSYVGAFSRFDDRIDDRVDAAGHGVFVLNGAGGSAVTTADVDRAGAFASVPWTGIGLAGQEWTDDVWTPLVQAGVVVTHAGQNALAEVAAARRPAVVVAQVRPFDEQVRVAAALDRAGIAVSVTGWPAPELWPAVLGAALSLGGDGWKRWSSGTGAAQAAAVVTGCPQRWTAGRS